MNFLSDWKSPDEKWTLRVLHGSKFLFGIPDNFEILEIFSGFFSFSCFWKNRHILFVHDRYWFFRKNGHILSVQKSPKSRFRTNRKVTFSRFRKWLVFPSFFLMKILHYNAHSKLLKIKIKFCLKKKKKLLFILDFSSLRYDPSLIKVCNETQKLPSPK